MIRTWHGPGPGQRRVSRRRGRSPGLFEPAVDEGLHAAEQVATMIVVAGGDYQREINLARAGRHLGSAVRHRCQPKARSSARKRNRGIQRKYHTRLYSYFTYSGMLNAKMWSTRVSVVLKPWSASSFRPA